ncbi:MAG: hypothetical protein M1828_001909 [Chrysothrix sp. TS-e1954]|nr:MAG: hypothetical protein M1828_001909 [Chrysothrix sp. TS-e1954]
MSTWSRLNNWASSASGRFSPFSHPSRPPSSEAPTVTDSDFSYITNEDLAAEQNRIYSDSPATSFSAASGSTGMGANASSTSANSSSRHGGTKSDRDTDILTFKHKKQPHVIHFPHSSIDNGTLSLSEAKAAIARKLSLTPSRIRLFHAGRNLSTSDDRTQCRDVGLRSDSSNDILVIVGASAPSDSGSGSEGEEGEDDILDGDGADGNLAGDGKKRRKRKPRKKKSKTARGTDSSGTSTPTVEHLPMPTGLHPSQRPSSTSTPPPQPAARAPSPAAPQTPMAKLEAISHLLNTTLAPQAENFMAGKTPGMEDKAKRDFEYKRLSETILTQVVLKLDGVETEGDVEARTRRKELVRESQGILNRLDDRAKM